MVNFVRALAYYMLTSVDARLGDKIQRPAVQALDQQPSIRPARFSACAFIPALSTAWLFVRNDRECYDGITR